MPERVVFVCATYLPRITGVATALHAWTRQLNRLGTRVTVVAPDYPPFPFYPPPVYPDGLEVVRLPSRPAPLVQGIQTAQARGADWDALLASLRGQRALVHGQDVLLAGCIALKIGRACRLPVVLHGHYPLGDGDPSDWLPFTMGRTGRRALNSLVSRTAERKARSVCRGADVVAVVSSYVQELFQRRRVADPIIVPCGIEVPAQAPEIGIRSRHGIPAGAPLFLYVGRMDPDKLVGQLLESVAHMRKTEPRVRLLLVGGGPYLSRYVEKAAALRLGDAAVFAGWVPYRDVWAYYEQSDLFIIASPYEAQGLVVIEAQAGGLPVVGYRGGGVSLAVAEGRTGVLTDHTPEALAQAAIALWQDKARLQAMRAATRQQVAVYSIEQQFPVLLDAYARAMAR